MHRRHAQKRPEKHAHSSINPSMNRWVNKNTQNIRQAGSSAVGLADDKLVGDVLELPTIKRELLV